MPIGDFPFLNEILCFKPIGSFELDESPYLVRCVNIFLIMYYLFLLRTT